MPVSALDQHLKGVCRTSAHPHTDLPAQGGPDATAARRRAVRPAGERTGEAR
ncbi:MULTISPECIES: hypothetical protein [unclassified Micromonospora]|uniref:hypothetical protein n=1 Tax=unclassified Micromonospora TaxID=2617518 RepID=UPI002FF1D9D7